MTGIGHFRQRRVTLGCRVAGLFSLALAMALPACAQTWRSEDGVRAALVHDRDGVALCIETPRGKRLSAEAGIVVQLKTEAGKADDPTFRSEIFGAGYLPARHRHDLPDGWPWDKRRVRAELGVCLDGDDACIPVILDFAPVRAAAGAKPVC